MGVLLFKGGVGKCANPSLTPAPVAHPLPTLEKSRRTACRTAPTTRTTEGTPTMELTYQQVYPTKPHPSTQTHRPHLPTDPKLLRNRTTMPHLPTTRAPVGSTRPTIRRASTAQPAQNPQTPTQKNRPRHRAARAATPPKNPLRTPAACPPPRPTRHSPFPQHPPTYPETPRTSNQPSPQTAPTLLSRALGSDAVWVLCGVGFFGFGRCRFDACGVVGRYSVRMVASGLASCQRCVGPLQDGGMWKNFALLSKC
jgi:hypothetical protein